MNAVTHDRRASRANGSAARGTVYLVGAGPGSPDLITLRGLRLLSSADVIVYDRLVHPDLLDHAHLTAHRVFVGKARDRHTCSQDEITRILVNFAHRGQSVVRLKGGDPFVFGRGGEECLALAEAGIPFEVVPGISSAVAVPAAAGIPVTHRGISSAFTVVTGHSCTEEGDQRDWPALARAGTLVILMGLKRLPEIARDLIEGGISAETPAAVIASGTTAAQRVVVGPIREIGKLSRDLVPPATIVIGEVVELRRWIAWFDEARGGGTSPFDRQPAPRDSHAAPAIARPVRGQIAGLHDPPPPPNSGDGHARPDPPIWDRHTRPDTHLPRISLEPAPAS